ncbi:hypothetical protein BGZ65_009831 [Modicella reniformis]|uniref:Uncharacterized protein n=1 Tax=Modicella reniformis TaxID=1440133 RepID=A0A9P6M7A2_9FUNG|nr:hypothetical protein BGZ65_009831 [Modicella reniformis]
MPPKQTWKTSIKALNHQDYFGAITDLDSINHIDFFTTLSIPASAREAASKEWKELLHVLISNDNNDLRRVGSKLRGAWEKDESLGLLDVFWKERARDDTLKADCQSNMLIMSTIKDDYLEMKGTGSDGSSSSRSSASTAGVSEFQTRSQTLRGKSRGVARGKDVDLSHQKGNRQSSDPDEPFCINLDVFQKQDYVIDKVDVGTLFLNHQQRSAMIANKLSIKLNVDNMTNFLALNYIWELDHSINGLHSTTHNTIKAKYGWDCEVLSEEASNLCSSLDRELASTGKIRAQSLSDDFLEDIVHVYQTLSRKLPRRYLSFVQGNEDTFAHNTMDALFTTVQSMNSHGRTDQQMGRGNGDVIPSSQMLPS